MNPPPIYLAGPTASGKSAVALLLAEAFNGEIISVDSMQVYTGLDIGTAKPTRAERNRVPHHLIDVAPLTENFDAARFIQLAKQAEAEILARGKQPIYCGGTGLYFKALAFGLGEAPAGDPAVREDLECTPLTELLEELRRRDPETFEMIDRSNPRRVVRAVEVIRTTGRPFSELRATWNDRKIPGIWLGLARERPDLNERIAARVDAMFSEGLVDETKRMLDLGLRENRTAMQAIGYRQVVDHLDGKLDLASTTVLVKQKTRQYAKRQMTWFKRQLSLLWIGVQKNERAEATAARIQDALAAHPPATI